MLMNERKEWKETHKTNGLINGMYFGAHMNRWILAFFHLQENYEENELL